MGQVDHSINHGETARKILEVCSISMSLGGTLAGSQVSMVIQLLKERDMIVGSLLLNKCDTMFLAPRKRKHYYTLAGCTNINYLLGRGRVDVDPWALMQIKYLR